MSGELIEVLRQIEREKNIDPNKILEALKVALASSYKKNYAPSEEDIRVEIDEETGAIQVFSRVVDETKKGKPKIIEKEVTPKDFGRIAAQTAKQVILQRLREAERELMYDEYAGKEGDIVTGIVEQSDHRYTLVNLGRVEALLSPAEQSPNERYEHGTRLKAYIIKVQRTTKDPQVLISRTHPGLLRRLFELEVPEIYDGIVEIKSVAREPGYRSKIAVASRDDNVDPVGSCVGPKGSRVRMVVSELKGEKIDVVKWDENPVLFVANALSPAKVKEVRVNLDERTTEVIVPNDQLSLAIGKEGQNVRLAAKLTGWRIDIKNEAQDAEERARKEAAESKVLPKAQKKDTAGSCEATTGSGKPCRNKAKPGSKYCGVHQKLAGA